MVSVRLTEPTATLLLLLFVASEFVPVTAAASFPLIPNRFGIAIDSAPVLVAVVLFSKSALSVMETRTVSRSPTWAARWSRKKARLPGRQRLAASAGAC